MNDYTKNQAPLSNKSASIKVKKLAPNLYAGFNEWLDYQDKNVVSPVNHFCVDSDASLGKIIATCKEIALALRLPSDIRHYIDQVARRRFASHGFKSVEKWVLSRSELANNELNSLPEPHWRINTEAKRAQLAVELAGRCANRIRLCYERGINDLELVFQDLEDFTGFSLWLPEKRLREPKNPRKKDAFFEASIHVFADLQNEKLWQRAISLKFARVSENARRAVGMVSPQTSPYSSTTARQHIAQRIEAQQEWIKQMNIVNASGETLSLKAAYDASVSNPEVRRCEMMARVRGLKDYAEDQEHAAVFITMTAPSRFHRKKKQGKYYIDNPNWDGSNPRDAQEWLKVTWSRFRAWCKDNDLSFYGLRVLEPHTDGTPHWHGVFFMDKAVVSLFRKKLTHYQTQRDNQELFFEDTGKPKTEAIKGRVDVKDIDPSKGDAVGYIVKYVSKNIDGNGMDGLKDTDAEKVDIKSSVDAVTAWARLYGFRQFQFINAGSVTVWRELRRIHQQIEQSDKFETLRLFADVGCYASFYKEMGGHLTPRTYQAVKPLYVPYSNIHTGKVGMKITGLYLSTTGFEVCSRMKHWTLEQSKDTQGEARSLGLVSITVDNQNNNKELIEKEVKTAHQMTIDRLLSI